MCFRRHRPRPECQALQRKARNGQRRISHHQATGREQTPWSFYCRRCRRSRLQASRDRSRGRLRRRNRGRALFERASAQMIADFRMPISELTNRTDALKARTKDFAIRIFHLVDALPKSVQGRAVLNQIIRSGTSMAANYRAACRARSRAEFIAKIGVVEEEADEMLFWLELI